MFTVGEFSKLAQVSKRLLRYYDEIGLFKPVQIDAESGYRYYSAEQMPELNRILALKDLGLTLEQIRRMMSDQVSTEEIQGMLLMKKAEVEQQLQEEIRRVRNIEARLSFMRKAEANEPLNVLIKQIPAHNVMSTRLIVEDFDGVITMMRQIQHALPQPGDDNLCFLMCYDDDLVATNMDLELGSVVTQRNLAPVPLHNGLELRLRYIEAVETMATTVVTGGMANIQTGYAEIAMWIDRNGYRIAGQPREILLQLPHHADGSDLVTEIQYPVRIAG